MSGLSKHQLYIKEQQLDFNMINLITALILLSFIIKLVYFYHIVEEVNGAAGGIDTG